MKDDLTYPAVLIGGPPHAGKSVLTYSLTRALRQHGIEHYVMRACPDGEGHWSQEAPRQTAEAIRQKGQYDELFVQRVCADIAGRQVPFLVDVGGLPQGEQFEIFGRCTHAILLLRPQPAERDWHAIVSDHRLHLLADLISDLDGFPTLEAREPIIRGTLSGLNRGSTVQGEPFESLVERLITLFLPTTKSLCQTHTAKAPTELVLNLPQLLDSLFPGCLDWTPEMLPRLLAEVPAQTPLSAYGRAAHWIYTALALHAHPAPFAQFDARLGWVEPLSLRSGSGLQEEIAFEAEKREQWTLLHCTLRTPNLTYDPSNAPHVPLLPRGKGLILNGRLPLWLATSLAHFYEQEGLPWIAGYYPQKQGAVVVSSHVSDYSPGDILPLVFESITEIERN